MSPDERRQLQIYLNDHRAGSVGGMALARRCASANESNEIGRYLTDEFIPQLIGEQRLLDDVRAHVDARPSFVKDAVARLGDLTRRVKPNGAAFEPTGLARVVEVEALLSAVNAKQQLWATLTQLLGDDAGGLADAEAAARSQEDRLQEFHAWATSTAFGPTEQAGGR